VEVGEEVEAFPALGRPLVLHRHPIADRTKVIAKVEIAGGLNARNDTHVFHFSAETRRRRKV
jgi:hypothetical protein